MPHSKRITPSTSFQGAFPGKNPDEFSTIDFVALPSFGIQSVGARVMR